MNSGVLGNLDLQHILTNLASLVVPITQLVLAISFVSGMFFIFKGVALLKHMGESQAMRSNPQGITGPFLYLGIGAVLLYMPAASNVMSASMLGNIPSLFSGSDLIELQSEGGDTFSVNTNPNYDQNASSELMQYANIGIDQEWAAMVNTVSMYVQLIGFIAFVRGWFILASVGSPGGAQQGAFSKGLIHIIGGVIAINFVPFMQVIAKLVF